jgi:nucleoporin POM152
MNGTPRLRSSYPATPGSPRPSPEPRTTPPDGSNVRSTLPNVPETPPAASLSNAPVIPVNLVDAPSQRMYALAIYGLLLVWRLYDWWTLVEEDTSSIMFFLKWSFIDMAFLFGVPLLRIPWLEWSETTSFTACALHALMNGMLMFRIPVC